MRRLMTYALLFAFLLLGSGALEYIHNWAHELEDRLSDEDEAKLAPSPPNGSAGPLHRQHHHDESNCETHAQLHLAIILHVWAALLGRLEIWVALVSLLAVPLIPRSLPVRIGCRGPPTFVLAV